MKVLIGISASWNDRPCKMRIAETDELKNVINSWEAIDIKKLNECVNIKVQTENYKNNKQNPNEYIHTNFNLDRLMDGRNNNDFQITHVYYDEKNQPQLYKVVNSNGYISICDISEFEYRKRFSLLGTTLEELPSFVKKEPLSKAYEWWQSIEDAKKKSENDFSLVPFAIGRNTPVKLLYHYLVGVKGFKVGYHVISKFNQKNTHEYMLFKDTANIKLTETLSDQKHPYYSVFDQEKDPYPEERTVRDATMSVICNKEHFPKFNNLESPQWEFYDKEHLAINIDFHHRMISTYNQLELSGCISKDWQLNSKNYFFGMTESNLLPQKISLLSTALQCEKEGIIFDGYTITASHGKWSSFHTFGWIHALGLAISMQFYSKELKEKLKPVLQNYSSFFASRLKEMINDMGAKDALEVMRWTKENAKNSLQNISFVNEDKIIQKANVSVIDQMNHLFTYKRNNYPLPEWLQIYSPETIQSLGGVELLQQAIKVKEEDSLKETIQPLAEDLEKLRKNGQNITTSKEIIFEELRQFNDSMNEFDKMKR